jgi:ring-1,2-phenylacetyl-CoA epoxidase subunit PaaE
MDTLFYSLDVNKIVRETEDAVSIFFSVPENLKETFAYLPGQYITLRFMLGGVEQRRAYSICTSPVHNELGIAVKRVEKGLVSKHIVEKVEVGSTMQVMPPQGHFIVNPNHEQRKTYYLFGAGSGITPLMSILKTILEREPASTVHLLYGNRHEESIIFKKELDGLQSLYYGQLFLEHILSQPKREKAGGLGGLFSKGKMNWKGAVGRIDKTTVEKFLENHPKRTAVSEYYICGPADMMITIENVLTENKIDKKNIYLEYFKVPETATISENAIGTAQVTVSLRHTKYNVQVGKNDIILDELIKRKIDAPYSCTSGACSTCMAKLTSGTVKMRACFALDDDEVKDGYILVCQSVPTSDIVELTFDI